jgi:valyl-tRNA synthetase
MKLSKVYEPKIYEPTVYGLWESSRSFEPKGEGEPYTLVMPPPNANGNLHIGHGLDMNLKDVMARYYRMKGSRVAYIPGADHAGFETWVVYEKELQKQGKSRFDFSREKLYQQVWDFVEAKRGGMELQLRALGVSADWSSLVFTLDEKVVDTVYGTFKKLWDDGLIYRGERIVNYCTKHQTSFADIEVSYKEEDTKLWNISYPLMERVGELVVATTRPETLLGDTAIAVHPDDPRYKDLIGMHVQVPIVMREVPIIADEAIDPTFGTGAVKVTPAHDPTDFDIGERNLLPVIQVIGTDGKITGEVPGSFTGLTAAEARERVLQLLANEELLRGEEDYRHSVGHCYKCGTVIQPLVMDQWFVRMRQLAEPAIAALNDKQISFHPDSKRRELIHYLEQIKDWNISRQIPWGIPIPAFQNIHDHNDWIYDTRVELETIEVDGKTYKREEDTLDTWFSSGQWPYIVTDYLTAGKYHGHFPTDLMETGTDLLRPWISRMIMLSLYRTEKIPFKDVYMHGMVLDEHSQKMSKSKGNVINPMEIVTEFGADAFRLGIIASRTAAQNQAFSTAKVVAGRNFCNKLWNIARFVESIVDEPEKRSPSPESLADHWIIRQLNEANATIEDHLKNYRFAEAADTVYHTIWNDVADWYLEAHKAAPNKETLAWVLETSLKLAHPFAPFVTETIWTTLAWEHQLLIASPWPHKARFSKEKASQFDELRALVTEARFVASELPGGKQTLVYRDDSLIADNAAIITHLARLQSIEHAEKASGLRLAVPKREAWLKIDPTTLYEHQTKLELRLVECRGLIEKLEGRLSNKSYVDNAPEKVVDETKKQLEEQKHLESRLVTELEVL